MNRRLLTIVAVVWALCVSLLPAATAQEVPEPLPDLDAIDPVKYGYDDAVVESVQVPSRDGINQIWVDIIRPNTEPGVKVPTIMMASPYFNTLGRGYKGELKTPYFGPSNPRPVSSSLGGGSAETPFPEWYDEYFVPRGYAFAAMDLRGTRNTSGCQTYGDRDEVIDAVDVIDWIADQEWSNGKVGMTGGSYDGTIAIGAAAEYPMSGTHDPGTLAAIIPIRAIDRWYDYAFVNGAQVLGQSLVTPSLFTVLLAADDQQNSAGKDLLFPVHVVERKACIATFGAAVSAGHASPYQDARGDFWRERDFVRSAGGFRAATFIMHGLYDISNVKPHNASHLWDALVADAPELPKRLWWWYGDHVDPKCPPGHGAPCNDGSHFLPHAFDEKFVEANHRWWLQYLKGVEAGALAEPAVEVQREDGTWDGSDSYPASTSDLVLNINPDSTLTTGPAEEGALTYRDGPNGSGPANIVLETAPFAEATRISGQIGFDLDLAATGRDTTVGVTIEAIDTDLRPVFSYANTRAYYRDTVNLRGRSTPTAGSFLEPGTRYTVDFPSQPTDVIIPAGASLKFTISPSAGGTIASNMGGTVSLFTGEGGSRILIPTAPAQ